MYDRRMEYLQMIAACGNITRASERLFVSQPTLSKFLQQLEEELGLKLFEKVGGQYVPTYAGERYLERSKEILRMRRELDLEMQDILEADVGILRIGMPPFRSSFFLPQLLPRMMEQFPRVRLELVEGSSSELDQAVLSGRADIVFYNLNSRRKELEYEVLARNRLYVLLKKEHPARARAVPMGEDLWLDLKQIREELFLLPSKGQRIGQRVRKELQKMHLTPDRIMEMTNLRASAAMAAKGAGVAFLSEDLNRHFEERQLVDQYLFTAQDDRIEFGASWRKGAYMPRYMQELLRIAREEAVR